MKYIFIQQRDAPRNAVAVEEEVKLEIESVTIDEVVEAFGCFMRACAYSDIQILEALLYMVESQANSALDNMDNYRHLQCEVGSEKKAD